MKELSRLALARYPNEPLPLALMMFESDRRVAGLGALAKRPMRDRCWPVMNTKAQAIDTRNITWRTTLLSMNVIDHQPSSFSLTASVPEFVQFRRLPHVELMARMDWRTLNEPNGRSYSAHLLRELRRQRTKARSA